MSRLLLICLISLLASCGMREGYSTFVELGDEDFSSKDYQGALNWYDKAYQLDSFNLDLNWKIAETYRLHKDYKKAAFYYHKLYEKTRGQKYPEALLNYGIMLKSMAEYQLALDVFKKAKKKSAKEKKGYTYKKAKNEVESCIWAINQVLDSMDLQVNWLKDINTYNSELAPVIPDSSIEALTLMKEDSLGEDMGQIYANNYALHIYDVGNSTIGDQISAKLPEGTNFGNGCFTKDRTAFYFSSNAPDLPTKIWVAELENGEVLDLWELGAPINEVGKSSTQPSVAYYRNTPYLFFASNQDKTKGGLDIFYSEIQGEGHYGRLRNLGRAVNSIEDEITPFYDEEEQTLYFSTTWRDGFGGTDVFKVKWTPNKTGTAVNAGFPINSPQNDHYFIKKSGIQYVVTNRTGVLTEFNPNCCYDVIAFSKQPEPEVEDPFKDLETLNKYLPVTLFFHNDRPNPNNRDTVTEFNYLTTYDKYKALEDEYRVEYSQGLRGTKKQDAIENMDDFFTQYVDLGVYNLERFTPLLLEELQKGRRIRLTVQGFASPLAKTDYNVNLTKRRISSMVNFLSEYENGVFIPYLKGTSGDGGYLEITQVPFGEYSADQLISDNPNDKQNSVYSVRAALERKIEMQSVTYIEEADSGRLFVKNEINHFSLVNVGDTLNGAFVIENIGNQAYTVTSIDGDLIINNGKGAEVYPGDKLSINASYIVPNKKGFHVIEVTLVTNADDGIRTLKFTYEVK